MSLPSLPSLSRLGESTEEQRRYAPTPLAGQRLGFLNQLGKGVINPITGTLASLGVGRHPDAPVTTADKWGRTLGSMISWGLIGGAVLAAPVTGGTSLLAGPLLARLFTGAALTLAKRVTAEAVTWGAVGAWEAFASKESIGKGALYGALGGAAFPLGGAALGKLAKTPGVVDALGRADLAVRRARGILPAESKFLEKVPTGQRVSAEDALDLTLTSMSEAQASPLLEQVRQRLSRVRDSLPSGIDPLDYTPQMLRSEGGTAAGALFGLQQRLQGHPNAPFIFRPVTQFTERIRRGDSMLSVRERTLIGATQAEALPGIDIPGIKKPVGELTAGNLIDQVRRVERGIQRQGQLLEETMTKAHVNRVIDLTGDAAETAQRTIAAAQVWEQRKFMLEPKIAEALNLGLKGKVPALMSQELEQILNAANLRGKSVVAPDNEELVAVLRKYKVGFEEQLPPEGKLEFRRIEAALEEAGIDPYISLGSERALFIEEATMPRGLPEPKGIDPKTLAPQASGPPGFRTAEQRGILLWTKPITSLEAARLTAPVNALVQVIPRRGILGEGVQRVLRYAQVERGTFLNNWIGKLNELEKPFRGSKFVDVREGALKDFLEGRTTLEGLPENLRETASGLRSMLDSLGPILGIDPQKWVTDYLPRIHAAMTAGGDEKAGSLLKRAFGGETFIPEELKWFATFKRTGYLFPRENDVFRIIETYIRTGAKKFYLEKPFQAATETLEGLGSAISRRKYLETVQMSMLGRPGELERMVDETINGLWAIIKPNAESKRHVQLVSSFLTDLQLSGTLGFNGFAAVKNLTQMINSTSQLDHNFVTSIEYWRKARRLLAAKDGQELNTRLNPMGLDRQYAEHVEKLPGALDTLINRVPGGEILTKNQFKAYAWADKYNTDTAYWMKYLYDLDRGASPVEAAEMAYSFTMSTQFMYGIDSPIMFSHPIGKQLGMLMSWPLNFAYMLAENGGQHAWNKAVRTVASIAFGAELLTQTGWNFMSTHPLDTASGYLPTALFLDQQKWPITLRFIASISDYTSAVLHGDVEAVDTAWSRLTRSAWPYVPMASTPKRIIGFINAARDDWKIHDDRSRLKSQGTAGEAFRNLIGPTREALERNRTYDAIRSSTAIYQRTRRQAIQAALSGDMKTFQDRQEFLQEFYGKIITERDLAAEQRLRGLTAAERQAMGLPEPVRRALLEKGRTGAY